MKEMKKKKGILDDNTVITLETLKSYHNVLHLVR